MKRLTPALAAGLRRGTQALYQHPDGGKDPLPVSVLRCDMAAGRAQVQTLDRKHTHWVPFSRVTLAETLTERERAQAFIEHAREMARRLDARWKKGDPRR